MGSKWPIVTLGEIAEVGSSKRIKMSDYVSSGVPFFRSKEIIEKHKGNEISTELFISEQQYNSIAEKFGAPKEGEILLTSVGTLGVPYQVKNNDKFYFKDGNLTWFRNFKKNINPRYLYYWLTSDEAKRRFNEVTIGSTQQALTIMALKSIPMSLPPLNIQNAIVKNVDDLHNKLFLNRQINQTLEQMTQTLFKSWFVDFDPVIDNALDAGNEIPESLQARAELRQKVRASQDFQPLPANIRVLFPAEFKESELGWVPKGWMVKAADEISTISIGKTPPRVQTQWFSESNVGNVTWISIKDMGNCGVFTKGSSEYLVQEGVDKFNVKIVPKDSVILSFKLTLGRVSITSCDLTTNEAIAHFVSPKMGLTKEFIYCYLSSFDYGSLGSTSSIATAVNSKIIKQMPFIVPHIQISSLFEKKVCTFFQKLRSLAEETEALTQLRDTLLPKLISGELRLDEIPTP